MSTVNPTKKLREDKYLELLKNKIKLIKFRDNIFFYENEDFPVLPREELNSDLCELFKDFKEEFKTNTILSSMISKYHKRNHGSSEEMTKDELIRYYFPDDCQELNERILETAVKKNRVDKRLLTFYEYLFTKKQRILILQLNNALNNGLKETLKYCKLFNCASEVKKVLSVFSKRKPQTRKRVTMRSSSLKRGSTAKEIVNSTSSSKKLNRPRVRKISLGKKKKKTEKKRRNKRKSL